MRLLFLMLPQSIKNISVIITVTLLFTDLFVTLFHDSYYYCKYDAVFSQHHWSLFGYRLHYGTYQNRTPISGTTHACLDLLSGLQALSSLSEAVGRGGVAAFVA